MGMDMKKIYIVGIGPGAYEKMTLEAVRILNEADTIIGYQVYIRLVEPHFPGKEFLSTPMTKEAERCRMCFEETEKGKKVAMICSGDAGVYGMAGLMYKIGQDYPDIRLEVISGVTAASAGAALLGAPLIQDFSVISLSDRLTPWDTIERRLTAAAGSGMVICLYNPSSKGRKDYLARACRILRKILPDDVVCGVAENIGRDGESVRIYSLKELTEIPVNMFSTVFIGNERTRRIGESMATPRGYRMN